MLKKISSKIRKVREINIKFSWRRIWVSVIIFIVTLGVLFVGLFAYARGYEYKVFPGVRLGDVSVGGMDKVELSEFLHEMNDKLTDAGIRLNIKAGEKTAEVIVQPTTVGVENIVPLFRLDVEKEVERLISRGKTGGFIGKSIAAMTNRVGRPRVSVGNLEVDEDELIEELKNKLEEYESEAHNAGVKIKTTLPLDYEFTTSSRGIEFDYENMSRQIISAWSNLKVPQIEAEAQLTEPKILVGDIEKVESRLATIFSAGNLELKYTDPHTKRNYKWTIYTDDIAEWIEPQKIEDNGIGFGLSASSTESFLDDEIGAKINVEAQNAKFKIGTAARVSEFQGSRPGIGVDIEKTYSEINEAILQRSWHDEGFTKTIAVTVEQVEPEIKTGEVNDLGIKEILGTGYSNFSGSPGNRVKNIRHAVKNKLEGLLIKPDEEFSLLNALAPFTIEGGYLPELVIKGDEIKPEVAGGLCQVGSTMFRTAMNSGLLITNRRNHSLVVNYYNDHRNGKPGTDATIYDPAPDLKFKNDTGNYILITTSMNTSNGDMYFTMWGTNDGRKGYYSPPVVLSWIPTGPTKEIFTTDLAPGARKCQGAHPGARTTFTYTREMSDGEKENTVYDSYYRPLPTICLVGVEEGSEECSAEDGEDCTEEQDSPSCSDEDGGCVEVEEPVAEEEE